MQNETTVSCAHPEGALYDPAIPPLPSSGLIGREQELASIKQQLQNRANTTLTLHGLPGIGKTSLAIALAHDPEIRNTFTDGILWVGVGPHPNLLSLLSRWAGLLGISATQMAALRGIDEWAFAIRNAIGTRKMLLIIDDIWQYDEVQTLRVGAHNCAYLITTRSRDIAGHLALDGTMLIEELNTEQSVQLLNRVAQEAVSQETQKVQDLVQAVGGLPLALTLLGNYLRNQASYGRISTALERLGDAQERFQISDPQVSRESHPSLPDSTSLSLHSVIAVTDQLLPEAARTAFYKLAIFPPKPNNFSEEAAVAVTGGTFEELDILSDAGLVESYGDRCTLHQVIADYARLHLHAAQAEECEAYSHLIAYVVDFVEAHKKDYELLDVESNVIHLVLEQAYGLGKQAELVRVVCGFAPSLILRGRYEEAERHLKRASQDARDLNDDNGIAATLLYLGEIEQCLGNYAQAESCLQKGLVLARKMNDIELVCALLTQLGIVLEKESFQQAEAAYQEGLTLARNIGDHESICTLLDNLGWLIMKRGDFAQSERYLQEGLALARKIENRERVGGLLRRLGTLEIYRGNFAQAQSYLQEGLTIAQQLRNSDQICALLGNLGLVAAHQGKNAQAKISYQEGLELAQQIGHRERICSILINLGDVFVEEGNYIQAEISFQKGLRLAQQIGHREWVSTLLINLAMTARKQGHYNKAKRYLQESLALANQISRPDIICVILCELGNLSLSEEQTDLADEYFKKMLGQIPSGDQQLLALAYYGLARVCVLQRDRENARLYGKKSINIFETIKHQNVTEVKEWIKSALG